MIERSIMEYLNWILDNLDEIIGVVTAIVTAASLIAAITPSPKDDDAVGRASGWLAKFRAIVNLLAINVKNAKPKR